MNKRHSPAGFFTVPLCLSVLAASADGATFAMKAVGVNGRPRPQSSQVTVRPGDAVEIEVSVSGWGDYGSTCVERWGESCDTDGDCYGGPCEEFRLRTFQFTLDGLRSGDAGALLPLYWDGPRVSWPCAGDADCGTGGVCKTSATCGNMSTCTTCPAEAVCPAAPPWVCVGAGHDPASGTFIDELRADYAFAGLYTISAVRYVEPDIAAGAVVFDGNEAVADSGQSAYLGTVPLVPTVFGDPAGEAYGTFIVGFDTSGPVSGSFIVNQGPGETNVVPDTQSLSIRVVPVAPSRFGYAEASEGGAASAGASAVRVTLRKMYNTDPNDPDGAITCPAGRVAPSLAQFEGQTRWFGAPMRLEDDSITVQPEYLASFLVCTPQEAEVRDWSAGALAAAFGGDVSTDRVFFFGSEVVPCSIYEVTHCADPMDESTCQGPSTEIYTLAVGDAARPHGRVADPNFADIAAIVEKYKASVTPHETKALYLGNIVGDLLNNPSRRVGFTDIGAAVNSYKRIPYEEQGPCNPATALDTCGNPCNTAP